MPSHLPVTAIAHALKGIDFPCDRDGVVAYARRNNAQIEVVSALQELPQQSYETMSDVFQGFRLVRQGEPPEAADHQAVADNPPPLALSAPESYHEVLAPFLWPMQMWTEWAQFMGRMAATGWWWTLRR